MKDIGANIYKYKYAIDKDFCRDPAETMQKKLDDAKINEQQGYKDVANGSVKILKHMPGTIEGGK